MSDPRARRNEAPWEMAEFLPPQALEDVPWDRPAELPWPEADLDALAWNERWNATAYDVDYPMPPVVERVPVAAPVAAAATEAAATGSAPRPRFGRPVRSDEDAEFDDPYDEYAPLADDLDAPGQLTWTGGTVPLRPAASLDGSAPDQPPPFAPVPPPRPSIEPPTWSRSPRSVFGDDFGLPSSAARSLPTPDRPAPSAPAVPIQITAEPRPTPVEEYPPIPTDFKPQWSSVTPVRPVWSAEPIPAKPIAAPDVPPTWVQPTPAAVATVVVTAAPAAAVARPLPAPPPPASGLWATTSTAAALPAGSSVAVPPMTPALQARPPAAPSYVDSLGDPDDDGPSTATTLALMVVTGIVVVGLVLAFLHFMTGLFR